MFGDDTTAFQRCLYTQCASEFAACVDKRNCVDFNDLLEADPGGITDADTKGVAAATTLWTCSKTKCGDDGAAGEAGETGGADGASATTTVAAAAGSSVSLELSNADTGEMTAAEKASFLQDLKALVEAKAGVSPSKMTVVLDGSKATVQFADTVSDKKKKRATKAYAAASGVSIDVTVDGKTITVSAPVAIPKFNSCHVCQPVSSLARSCSRQGRVE